MAGMAYVLKATDFLSQLFPLNLVVAGKNYRILTKASNIQHISDNLDVVSNQLEKLLPPDPPKDPIFIDCIDGEVVIPQELFRNDEMQDNNESSSSSCQASTSDRVLPRDQASTSDRVLPRDQASTSDLVHPSDQASDLVPPSETEFPMHQDDNSDWEESGSKSRYEWKLTTTRKLLNILEEKKKVAPDSFSINKKIWAGLSKELSKNEVNPPSASQCREKFYTLKRGYRKFLSECKKTGNKTPKPFKYETEMQSILDGDPSFKPLFLCSSFGLRKDDADRESDEPEEDDDASTSSASTSRPSTPVPTATCKTKKRKIDEMREYFEERDKKFFDIMENMQNSNKELLTKLIEKLGK